MRLEREPSSDKATLGKLYVEGTYQCETLEDVIRELPGEPVERWKVPGNTAIPAGIYEVIITWSNKFARELPLLLRVPGFAYIRIHTGNKPEDTEGCILVGADRALDVIGGSRKAFAELFLQIHQALRHGESVRIEIVNPRADEQPTEPGGAQWSSTNG